VQKNAFADRIRELRDAEKLSQSEAADSWGVPLRTLQKWEIAESEPSEFVAKCILFYLRWRNRVPAEKRR
jgi:DNA-binding transcriptional regulator YiaG